MISGESVFQIDCPVTPTSLPKTHDKQHRPLALTIFLPGIAFVLHFPAASYFIGSPLVRFGTGTLGLVLCFIGGAFGRLCGSQKGVKRYFPAERQPLSGRIFLLGHTLQNGHEQWQKAVWKFRWVRLASRHPITDTFI
ncbi:MAG: hypothetical protein XE10_2053 [Methanoculleus marisnigri]|uniref:Uncharacterized protein n=1 Tax=Methanoculleus marisnigri TaxID=2198 RepID=A0A101ING9_9EURY|nr:MAG: hypothetical protein XE10_2053 [Methanoculleus marisnigri]